MHVSPLPPPDLPPTTGRQETVEGPLAQSVALAFRLLGAATAVMAVVWACSNIREVASDRTAVVERFGRVSHVQTSGLLLAWPTPFEQVRMLPAPSRQILLAVAAEATGYVTDETDVQLQQTDDVIHMEQNRDAANASYLLTGDGNVVRLDATLFFHITDPAAYVLSETHVAPALRRLFLASAVALAARHRLDDFLVAQPVANDGAQGGETRAIDPLLVARREALRGDLVQEINRRLAAIARSSQDLGVEVMRADLVAVLPPRAKSAFDEVLTASQIAEQNIAAARTDGAHIAQEADRERDRVLAEAVAVSDERIRSASFDVAPVSALEASLLDSHAPSSSSPGAARPTERDALLLRAWRERVAAILQKSGSVTVLDARSAGQAILPGPDEP